MVTLVQCAVFILVTLISTSLSTEQPSHSELPTETNIFNLKKSSPNKFQLQATCSQTTPSPTGRPGLSYIPNTSCPISSWGCIASGGSCCTSSTFCGGALQYTVNASPYWDANTVCCSGRNLCTTAGTFCCPAPSTKSCNTGTNCCPGQYGLAGFANGTDCCQSYERCCDGFCCPSSSKCCKPTTTNSNVPFVEGDSWFGTYQCNNNIGATNLELEIYKVESSTITAIFRFNNTAQGCAGSYYVYGNYYTYSSSLQLSPTSNPWISNPCNFVTVGLNGYLSNNQWTYSGTVNGPNCASFTVNKYIPKLCCSSSQTCCSSFCCDSTVSVCCGTKKNPLCCKEICCGNYCCNSTLPTCCGNATHPQCCPPAPVVLLAAPGLYFIPLAPIFFLCCCFCCFGCCGSKQKQQPVRIKQRVKTEQKQKPKPQPKLKKILVKKPKPKAQSQPKPLTKIVKMKVKKKKVKKQVRDAPASPSLVAQQFPDALPTSSVTTAADDDQFVYDQVEGVPNTAIELEDFTKIPEPTAPNAPEGHVVDTEPGVEGETEPGAEKEVKIITPKPEQVVEQKKVLVRKKAALSPTQYLGFGLQASGGEQQVNVNWGEGGDPGLNNKKTVLVEHIEEEKKEVLPASEFIEEQNEQPAEQQQQPVAEPQPFEEIEQIPDPGSSSEEEVEEEVEVPIVEAPVEESYYPGEGGRGEGEIEYEEVEEEIYVYDEAELKEAEEHGQQGEYEELEIEMILQVKAWECPCCGICSCTMRNYWVCIVWLLIILIPLIVVGFTCFAVPKLNPTVSFEQCGSLPKVA